jgi:hypothetical protein
MDNNMTAIISVIMIGLGFVNGMIVSTLLDKAEVSTLNCQLLREKQKSTNLQDTIDDLEDELVELKAEKEQILRSLTEIVHRSRYLPPPQGPLERSTVEPESEDETFECPISPSANPSCMD